MRRTLCCVVMIGIASFVWADVELTEHRGLAEKIAKGEAAATKSGGNEGTGGVSLVDASGLEFFINTDVTFSTDESASGAASEASYTTAVAASTSLGGTTMSTLDDAFDGYGGLIVNGTVYNDNGVPTFNAACGNRELIYNTQIIGSLEVTRRVFVPSNDEFMRWLDVITNPTGGPISVTVEKANNLGSDSSTILDQTASGDSVADPADAWVTSFQDYNSGGTSGDPRLGHVFFGAGGAVGLASIDFTDGENNPAWTYETFSLGAGETAIIASFVTGQPNRPDAATQAASLATLPANASQCISSADLDLIVNFVTAQQPPPDAIPTLGGWGVVALILLLAAAGIVVTRFVR